MVTLPQAPDLKVIKQRQQQTWATGDYGKFAAINNVLISELLCEAVDLRAGQKVLDVATGSGNTAIAVARRFCDVTGIDYVPAWLERGRARAAVEGLTVTFQEGDAEAIPFPDASFDVVLSTIGVMFAPDQEQAARELVRVCRPGGKIGLANWTPDGFLGELFRTNARYLPPPPGLKPPVLWGTEARLRELLGGSISALHTTRRTYLARYYSPQHWLEFFQTYYGPTLKTFEALDGTGQAALTQDLTELLQRFNRSGDTTLVVPCDYLEVVAVRQ